MAARPFSNSWYPPQWITWYCYGPPACNANPIFSKVSMLHLNKVKAKSRLESEQLIATIGAQSKAIRRSHVSRGANNIMDAASENVNAVVSNPIKTHQVNFQRNEQPIDRAIEACHASIMLMESMSTEEISFAAEIQKKKLDLLNYLRDKEKKAAQEANLRI